MPACTPTDVARIQLRRPSPQTSRPALAAAGTVLHDALAGLGQYVQNPGPRQTLEYQPALAAPGRCTVPGDVVVSLDGRPRRTLSISTAAVSTGGAVDRDRLNLRCRAH